jgi:hypothetical protein
MKNSCFVQNSSIFTIHDGTAAFINEFSKEVYILQENWVRHKKMDNLFSKMNIQIGLFVGIEWNDHVWIGNCQK